MTRLEKLKLYLLNAQSKSVPHEGIAIGQQVLIMRLKTEIEKEEKLTRKV